MNFGKTKVAIQLAFSALLKLAFLIKGYVRDSSEFINI